MELSDVTSEGGEVLQVDLSRFDLPVLVANEHETQAHEGVLTQIDKACKGRTIWRQLQPS
jgi:DNA polymerase-3 subunit epsilon